MIYIQGAGGGGAVAGGMARKFIDKYLEIKNRPTEVPQEGRKIENDEKDL